MHELHLNTNQKDLAKKYLSTLNGIFKLTKKEKDIVAELIIMGNPPISRKVRKEIRINLDVSNYHLNNYLGYLKKKSIILITEAGIMTLNPKVFVNTEEIKSKFSININFHIQE